MKQQYDAILALSFGRGNKVNKYLSEVVREIHKEYPEAKLILQNEILLNFTYPNAESITFHRQKGKYLDTFEMLNQAKGYLHQCPVKDELKGVFNNNIILIAHPLHFYRAKYIAERLGFKVSEGRVDKCLYDKKDPQIHCRNCVFFRVWDIFAWLTLLLKK